MDQKVPNQKEPGLIGYTNVLQAFFVPMQIKTAQFKKSLEDLKSIPQISWENIREQKIKNPLPTLEEYFGYDSQILVSHNRNIYGEEIYEVVDKVNEAISTLNKTSSFDIWRENFEIVLKLIQGRNYKPVYELSVKM